MVFWSKAVKCFTTLSAITLNNNSNKFIFSHTYCSPTLFIFVLKLSWIYSKKMSIVWIFFWQIFGTLFVDVLINNTYLNRLNQEFDEIAPWEFQYPREPKDLSKRMSSAFKKLYFNNQLVSNNTEKQLGEVVWYLLIPKHNIIHMGKALSTLKDDNNHTVAVLYRCCLTFFSCCLNNLK